MKVQEMAARIETWANYDSTEAETKARGIANDAGLTTRFGRFYTNVADFIRARGYNRKHRRAGKQRKAEANENQ